MKKILVSGGLSLTGSTDMVILRGYGAGGEDRLVDINLLGGNVASPGEWWLYATVDDLGEPDPEDYETCPVVAWRPV